MRNEPTDSAERSRVEQEVRLRKKIEEALKGFKELQREGKLSAGQLYVDDLLQELYLSLKYEGVGGTHVADVSRRRLTRLMGTRAPTPAQQELLEGLALSMDALQAAQSEAARTLGITLPSERRAAAKEGFEFISRIAAHSEGDTEEEISGDR